MKNDVRDHSIALLHTKADEGRPKQLELEVEAADGNTCKTISEGRSLGGFHLYHHLRPPSTVSVLHRNDLIQVFRWRKTYILSSDLILSLCPMSSRDAEVDLQVALNTLFLKKRTQIE